jgi:DNA-binding HxlR family transcriptional regulator
MRRGGRAAPAERASATNLEGFQNFARAFARSAEGPTEGAPAPQGTSASELDRRFARSLFGKWTLDILVLLGSDRPLGFGEIRAKLKKISSRILSAKLRQLESHGLVYREVLPTRPPRVLYGLTERGMTVARMGEPVLHYLRYAGAGTGPRRARSPVPSTRGTGAR